MDWFRAHHGITSDTKWAVIARKSGQCIGTVVSVWIAILDHASQNEDRGSLYGFDAETIDALYGYDDGVTASIITALETKGIIFGNRIVNWEKRQPEANNRQRNTTEYKAWRIAVFKRDGFTCQLCGGIKNKLNAHHIRRYRSDILSRTDVNNGVTLCGNCHKELHRREGQ